MSLHVVKSLGAALALTAGLVAGCATAHRGEPFTTPVPTRGPDEVRGEEVFMQHCHSCHPGGESGLAPSLHNRPLPAPMIRMQVRVGIGAMPGFSEDVIDDDDLDALITYLLLARRSEPYGEPSGEPSEAEATPATAQR